MLAILLSTPQPDGAPDTGVVIARGQRGDGIRRLFSWKERRQEAPNHCKLPKREVRVRGEEI